MYSKCLELNQELNSIFIIVRIKDWIIIQISPNAVLGGSPPPPILLCTRNHFWLSSDIWENLFQRRWTKKGGVMMKHTKKIAGICQ